MHLTFAHSKVMECFHGNTYGGMQLGVLINEKLDREELKRMCFDQKLRM
jgi:hypothetical protein